MTLEGGECEAAGQADVWVGVGLEGGESGQQGRS